jgi:threonine/homoserine/homoserine lactone efflux protein
MIRGILAGLALSAPVGPVNILCISRTLTKGRVAGLVSGLGAASADAIYGGIAAFSISFVIEFLVRELFWIRIVGGLLLIAIGVVYFVRKPVSLEEQRKESSQSDYLAAFFLTLTNPTTILSYLAALAVLRAEQHRPPELTAFVVAGIFIGAMLWWSILAGISGRFRDRVNDRTMLHMNRIAAFAIAGFGIVTLILSRGHRK